MGSNLSLLIKSDRKNIVSAFLRIMVDKLIDMLSTPSIIEKNKLPTTKVICMIN